MFVSILLAASVHPEYSMRWKGPGGWNEGSKHWKAPKAAALVFLEGDTLIKSGVAG